MLALRKRLAGVWALAPSNFSSRDNRKILAFRAQAGNGGKRMASWWSANLSRFVAGRLELNLSAFQQLVAGWKMFSRKLRSRPFWNKPLSAGRWDPMPITGFPWSRGLPRAAISTRAGSNTGKFHCFEAEQHWG